MKMIRPERIRAVSGIFRRLLLLFLFHQVFVRYSNCQDSSYARSVIDHLCSERMHGRGFGKSGDLRAARYIARTWAQAGIEPVGKDFFQYFSVNINTFPGAMNLRVNGNTLIPGKDFLVDPASPGLTGSFIPFPLKAYDLQGNKADSLLREARGRVVLVDARDLGQAEPSQLARWNERVRNMCLANPYGIKGLIEVTGARLIFDVAARLAAVPHVIIAAGSCPQSISSVNIHIENKYVTGYKTQNITGIVKGRECPDSFLLFTAHYDHLGMLGRQTFFPGANDNASGVSMLICMSEYFSRHPQRFSVVLISFSGEELGLAGSEYFAENPLIQLSRVKFLVNLDIVGTGEEGITVVNAVQYPGPFARLESLNEKGGLVPDIRKRGTACNSDHCPFFSKGIPSFYIYTRGGIKAYHDVYDRPETLPLTAFEGLRKLLIGFAGTF
jgi:aminopeptidase YwaD